MIPVAATVESLEIGPENPWPGLLSFREADQRWFKGREEETASLMQHVKRERLTVLYALSGLGKSSLLQAGVFPALRRENIFPIHIRLDYADNAADLRTQTFDAIAAAAVAADVSIRTPDPGESLWEYLHHVQTEFWSRDERRVLALLAFDQFEEIFTLGRSESNRQRSESFLEELADLAEPGIPPHVLRKWEADPQLKDDYLEDGEYKVLIALREDFFPEFSDPRRGIARAPQKYYRLRQMSGKGALSAVSQASHVIDESVAEQVVRYIGGEMTGSRSRRLEEIDVDPALLSVVCRELNNRRRVRGEPRITIDLLEGDRQDVLNDFYERSLNGMAPEVRTFVEDELVTVAGARNSVPIENALAAKGVSASIIEELVERRLLRKEHKRNEIRLELTHDLLTGVVATSRNRRRREEAMELARVTRNQALAKARRSRIIATAMSGLALVSGFFWYRSTKQTRRAEEQTTLAVRQTGIAQEQRQRAEEALREVQEQRRLATEAADLATRNEKEAMQQADRADREAEVARKQTELAQRSAAAESRAAERERQQTSLAIEREKQARASARVAEDAKQASDAAKAETEKANRQLADREKESRKEAGKSLLNDAASHIAAGQSARAMGSIARALVLDPDSVAARTWALDQLLRGAWTSAPPPSNASEFIHPRLTHPAGVLFAALSPDDRVVATASRDNVVRLWDAASGKLLGEISGHKLPVVMVAFSPDGRRLLTASYDQTAKLWDVATRAQVLEFKHGRPLSSAAFGSDGRRIITASQDKTAQVWDASTGAKVGQPLQHSMTVNYAAFSPDQSKVVTACADSRARIWTLANGRAVELRHQGEVKSAAFNRNGSRVATASSDGTARVWDAASGNPLGEVMQHGGPVYFAAFSNDGVRVATASRDSTARLWDAASGRPMTWLLQHQGPVLSATFSHDSRRLVTASDDKTVRIWQIWYDFDHVDDLTRLIEAAGGYSAAQPEIPPLSEAERKTRTDQLRAKMSQQTSAARFLRWFFANRQNLD